MPNTEKLNIVAEAYREYGSQRKAADALGMSRRSFRRYLDQYNALGFKADPGFKVTKISKTLDRDGNTTSSSVVTKLAPATDHLKRDGKVVRRSTLYGADGGVVGEWIIRKPEDEATDDYIKALDKHFVDNIIRAEPREFKEVEVYESKLALFMSIDEHINMKAIGLNNEYYGLKDAVEIIESKFNDIVNLTPFTRKALYVSLGDIFHQNDHMNVTPANKNALDSDDTFDNAADAAVLLHRKKIERLLDKYEIVEVHGVAGNHDIDASGWLLRCLQIAYENEPRVSVTFHPRERFAIQFGNTMLGFHHGHRIKPDQLASIITDENSGIYGDTTMRYLHTGHVHHNSARDVFGGYLWHSHRTISPKDWHSDSLGYVSRRSMKSYLYDVYEGEVANFTTSII